MSEYKVPRVSTGVQGLDEMLGGGVPEQGIILLCGGPGAGKTIMSMQYMMNAVKNGEPTLYVSLEEPMEAKAQNALAFGWDIRDAMKKGLVEVMDVYMVPQSQGYVDPYDRMRGKIQTTIEDEIDRIASKMEAKHIIIDPLTSILVHEQRSGKKRYIIGQIFDTIRKLGCSALITSEGLPSESDFYMEEFLADGVVLLVKDIIDYKLIKTLRIDKMRGIDFDDQPRRYVVSGKGFQVFNNEQVLSKGA
jgi:KaiC/GvpD/RAD55 family RecA-like ATPase